MRRIGQGEHRGALGHALLGQAKVHVVGREQPEAAVATADLHAGASTLSARPALRQERLPSDWPTTTGLP